MLLEIRHRTELTYTERIHESVIELRVTPRSDKSQTLRSFGLTIGPEAPVFNHRDWNDNQVHHFSIAGFHERVVIAAFAMVETHPARVDLESAPDALPVGRLHHRFHDFLAFAGPVTRDARLGALAESIGFSSTKRTAEVLQRVMKQVGDKLDYERGVTSSSTSVSAALDAGKGVCQDFAHLGIALLRRSGIPARYVSGYVHREGKRELETHAWCEAFLPSIGWVGIDPTHRELAGERHVAVAAGRSYADVPPNRGVYRGDAEESIAVSVAIRKLDDVLAPHSPVWPGPLDVPVFRTGPAVEEEVSLFLLEQQQQEQQ